MAQGTPVKRKKRSKSVLKNIRKAEQRTIVNRSNRTRVRTAIRQLRTAIGSGDAGAAEKLVPQTYSEIDRAVKNRSLPQNTANRYKSRLALALNAMKKAKKT